MLSKSRIEKLQESVDNASAGDPQSLRFLHVTLAAYFSQSKVDHSTLLASAKGFVASMSERSAQFKVASQLS